MPNPGYYPAPAAIFDPYTGHAIIEEISNVILDAGLELDVHATNQLATAINAKIAAAGVGAPVGSGLEFHGSVLPAGYLWQDGSLKNIATYPALFAVIGTQYGGDGVTTFGMPDKRGRSGLGKDNMGGTSANRVTDPQADILGGSGGEEKHTMTLAELFPHTHTSNQFYTSGGHNADNGTGNSGATTGTTSSTGGGQPFNVMHPYLVCNYIIKY
jgi:microcystin-dependent protein